MKKLTVCVSTYRQEAFIGDCLNSLISQKTNFDWEILVSDDCSPDRTLEIIEDIASRSDKPIKVIKNEKNRGPFVNYVDLHSRASGEYVAHIDGDDMLLPGKLQIQVDYMESNPECNVCWHRMLFFNERFSQEHPSLDLKFINRKIYANELCYLGPIGSHSSTMYRRKNFSKELFTDKCDDWFMSLLYIKSGYAIVLDEVLGAYRISSNSMSSGAKATLSNRTLSTSSQRMALSLFPQLSADISTRALANFVLDLSKFRFYCLLSLKIVILSGKIPKFWRCYEIMKFYAWSRLPRVFYG